MKTYKVTVDDEGTIKWYNENNKLHREDGPAVEWPNGDKSWYINDKRHREDGPAIEYNDGAKSWYLDGKYLTEEQFNKTNIIVCKCKIPEPILKVSENGTHAYCNKCCNTYLKS